MPFFLAYLLTYLLTSDILSDIPSGPVANTRRESSQFGSGGERPAGILAVRVRWRTPGADHRHWGLANTNRNCEQY